MLQAIHHFTVACRDNGQHFIESERLDRLTEYLEGTQWGILQQRPLARVYRHAEFVWGEPIILVSAHVDSLYGSYHSSETEPGILTGTYDNSACNAIIATLMKLNVVPRQVLAAFTGDEEVDSRGAIQAVDILESENLKELVHCIAVLDLTFEGYPDHYASIENVILRDAKAKESESIFKSSEDIEDFVFRVFKDDACSFVDEENSEPDETWDYCEYGFPCLSFCLPCEAVVDDDMHDDAGVRIQASSIEHYAKMLNLLLEALLKRH